MKSLSRSIAAFLIFVTACSAQDPELLKQLSTSERSERREAAVKIQKMGAEAKVYFPALIGALNDPDKQVWSSAIATIAAIGPDAAEAIPLLIKDMDSRKARGKRTAELRQAVYRNAYALGRIGSVAVPALIEALRSEDVMTQQGAAKALEYIGDKGQEAIPALCENLIHPHADLREDVINALSIIALKSNGSILAMLDSEEPLERQGALLILGKMGTAAANASGRLLQMSDSESEATVRATLLETLVAIGAAPERVFPLLMSGIQNKDPAIRHAALNGLLVIDSEGRFAIPEILVLLFDDNPDKKRYAAHLAGCYGEAAQTTVPALLAIVQKAPADSQFAIDALAKIGAPAAREILRAAGSGDPAQINREHWAIRCIAKMGGAATPELIKGMEDTNAAVRFLAVLGCTAIHIEAVPATEEIVRRCTDSDAYVRAATFWALAAVEVDAGRFLPLIELGLKDPVSDVRVSALAQIPYLKDAGKPLTSSLLTMMSDESMVLRKAAILAISSNMEEAISPLIKCMEDEALRDEAIETLGRFGAKAQSAIPKLVKILAVASKETRRRIISTLALIGSSETVVPLAGALKDEDAECRAAAVAAYLKVERDPAVKLPIALSMLEDTDPRVRRSTTEALSLLGDLAKEATPQLVKMLQSETDRDFTLEAMRRLSVKSIPDLIEILGNSHHAVRLFAVQRLGQIGPTASDSAPHLKAILEDSNQSEIIRGEAKHALRKMNR